MEYFRSSIEDRALLDVAERIQQYPRRRHPSSAGDSFHGRASDCSR
jgi:hypothetical protein